MQKFICDFAHHRQIFGPHLEISRALSREEIKQAQVKSGTVGGFFFYRNHVLAPYHPFFLKLALTFTPCQDCECGCT